MTTERVGFQKCFARKALVAARIVADVKHSRRTSIQLAAELHFARCGQHDRLPAGRQRQEPFGLARGWIGDGHARAELAPTVAAERPPARPRQRLRASSDAISQGISIAGRGATSAAVATGSARLPKISCSKHKQPAARKTIRRPAIRSTRRLHQANTPFSRQLAAVLSSATTISRFPLMCQRATSAYALALTDGSSATWTHVCTCGTPRKCQTNAGPSSRQTSYSPSRQMTLLEKCEMASINTALARLEAGHRAVAIRLAIRLDQLSEHGLHIRLLVCGKVLDGYP